MFDFIKALLPPDNVNFEKEWPDFRMFAIRRHADQKYGELPYAYHLAMVECVLSEYGYSDHNYQAAAWLHDSVEDAGVKYESINYSFGPIVTALVHAVTGEGHNRKERVASIYKKLKVYPDAIPLKVADRLANLTFARGEMNNEGATDKVEMYLKEWPEFRDNLKEAMQLNHSDRLMWNDLDTLVEKCKEELEETKKSGELSPST